MRTTFTLDNFSAAVAREAGALVPPPSCADCGVQMDASERRAQRRAVARPNARPLAAVVLPTWKCSSCGQEQPRVW